MSRALGLLSGGLDSTLAALLLRRQGVDVTCVAFVTPFFGAARAEKAANTHNLPLIVMPIAEAHLEMVKNPRYGYGRNMNPCIDCHAMMFRRAGRLMEEQGFDFVFSGEVLAQRPMSQNLSALQAVAKHSGYPKQILRPLSAKLLPITPMEESGLVDRERLLDIQGRTRRRQEELAKDWGVSDYPSSGGGCLLTEKLYSDKLRQLLTLRPQSGVREVEMLKSGRFFPLDADCLLFVGRNQNENEQLSNLASGADLRLRAFGFSGPQGIVVGTPKHEDLVMAAAIVAGYGKGRDAEQVTVGALSDSCELRLQVAPQRPGHE